MTLTPAVAAARASQLDAEARQHKRAAAYHRRQAQLRRDALRRFVDECREAGIPVTIAIARKAEADDRRTHIRSART